MNINWGWIIINRDWIIEIFDVIGVLVAGAAILYAIKQSRDATRLNKQTQELSAQNKQIVQNTQELTQRNQHIAEKTEELAKTFIEIRNSLPTRYIGDFPSFLEGVVKLIGSAKQEIFIVCDVLYFGYFSAYIILNG